ncbi:MAG: N-acetyltransferase family protein [Solirubrobacterales bacterium]
MSDFAITTVGEGDLDELLPLMRAYCDFYEVAPVDADLLGMSRALIADPNREGVQLIARDGEGAAVGFATVFWTWQTLDAGRLAVMNDLFVSPGSRGDGLAEALIEGCADQARRHGALSLGWQTAGDNERAQKVYDRVGAERSQWLDYTLALDADGSESSE